HLLTELCEGLADEYDITVVAGAHPDAARGRSRRGGVEILRVASTSYDRRSLSLRALNYLTYVGLSTAAGMGARRPDIVLCMTDPPFLGDVAKVVAGRLRAPLLVITHEVFPDIPVHLERREIPALDLLERVLDVA